MTPFVAELVGSTVLITLGNGVVANMILPKTKGNNGGVIAITLGWAIAVFVGVLISANTSGAHLNPAVTIGLAAIGKFDWAQVPAYLLAQILGAMLGSTLVWIMYHDHFNEPADAGIKHACFCTTPSIKNAKRNFITEFLATLIFILTVLFITKADNSLGSLDALPVALLVLGVGLSFGGPTGYAINPSRDLGPRIMFSLLPIKNKGANDWSYSWIPVVAPICGGVAAALLYTIL